MKDLVITAKAGKGADSPSASLTVKAPESAKEAVEVFGDEAVCSNAVANWTVSIQGRIRSAIKAGKTAEQIQQELGDAKMGVSLPRASADPTARIKSDWAKVPDEVKRQLLADLKAKLGK